jgi:hypothetical protein
LNPKKCFFDITKWNLLGNFIIKEGRPFDLEQTKTIMQIASSHDKREMQSFFGKINFVRKFTSNFIEIIKPLQKMIKKDAIFE